MASQTTIKTLRERVERLNDKLGRELELSSHSMGRRGRAYQLDDENSSHINPRGALAKEMDYFLDGVFAGLRLIEPDADEVTVSASYLWALEVKESSGPSRGEYRDARKIINEHGPVMLERSDDVDHKFKVDDYALDGSEPTPSPEANTVRIVELIDERADEFVIEETGKTVAEHNPYYPPDDPVVAGVYPNMGDPDKVWHFPESRLYKA